MYFLGTIIASTIGYLIGSISFSIIVVKIKKGVDIRTVGSKNAGATNTTRVLGKWWGLIVVFLDGLKVVWTALIAVALSCIPNELFSQTSYFIPAIFVLIGHCYPIWHKFKGGKAVATFLGLLFISNIWFLAFFLILWFASAKISRKVSVASIVAAIITGGIFIWIPWVSGTDVFSTSWNSFDQWNANWNGPNGQWLRFAWLNYLHVPTINVNKMPGFADSLLEINIVILIGMIILAYRHFPNIKRLKNGTESETFPKKVKQKNNKTSNT